MTLIRTTDPHPNDISAPAYGTVNRRPIGLIIVAALALGQSLFGIVRAFEMFHVGAELSGQGILMMPLLGLVMFARGGMVIVLALLHVVFAWGAFTLKHWAWWFGLLLGAATILCVLAFTMGADRILTSLVWAIVPAIVISYLLTPTGRKTFAK